MVHGIIEMIETSPTPSCFQHKLIYGLYIVPIVTSFFSVLGMSIERFQAFALYRDRRRLTRKFSIAWFMSSWTLGEQYLSNQAIPSVYAASAFVKAGIEGVCSPLKSLFCDHP